jgi:hypothetical protein
MKQLQRKINGKTYYCEHAGTDFEKAESKKKAAKYVGWFARIFKVKNEYQVFVATS